MIAPSEMTTVFRSLDENSEEEAKRVRDVLIDAGIYAVVVDDKVSGVVAGTHEVRVPPTEQAQADAILQAEPELESDNPYEPLDPSHDADLVTVFSAENATAEMEASSIQSILKANGIQVVTIGSTMIPSLRFEVRVPKDEVERARQAIAEAQQAGPAAAEEAERASERPM